jgi:hypothetical protein
VTVTKTKNTVTKPILSQCHEKTGGFIRSIDRILGGWGWGFGD